MVEVYSPVDRGKRAIQKKHVIMTGIQSCQRLSEEFCLDVCETKGVGAGIGGGSVDVAGVFRLDFVHPKSILVARRCII